jgi:predicted ATPase
MIDYIYIDNYKCFVNFEIQLGSLHLVAGLNGSGKTTVFDTIDLIRKFIVDGESCEALFPTDSLTAWDQRSDQTFEIGLTRNGESYRYQVRLQHDRRLGKCRIQSERLTLNQRPLYEFDGKDAHLYRDDFSAGPVVAYGSSRSFIASIPEREDNQHLTWFRRRIESVYVFSPDPLRMESVGDRELARPDRPLHQFVSWLRHLSQESVDTLSRLRDSLSEDVIQGLSNMRLERLSETTRGLKFDFDFSDGATQHSFSLPFNQLSDGQKSLVALFTIVHAMIRPEVTICIDEPDNYVAIRELQPWLTLVRDRVQDTEAQCLLISHHPEIINYLAAHHGIHLDRDSHGPVRAKPFEWDSDELISPAELMARGWE